MPRLFLCGRYFVLRLKIYGFLRFIYIPFVIAVSSLDVLLYAFRSSADDFHSKLPLSGALVLLQNLGNNLAFECKNLG